MEQDRTEHTADCVSDGSHQPLRQHLETQGCDDHFNCCASVCVCASCKTEAEVVKPTILTYTEKTMPHTRLKSLAAGV